MTLEDQIAELTRLGSRKILLLARPGVLALTAALVLAGAITDQPVFYGIALASAAIAFAIWQTTPHISNAARGLSDGLMQDGSIEISIHPWTGGESIHFDSYRGLISIDDQPLWQMEFVTPQNWQPLAGKYSVRLAFIRGVEWPVVILLDEGLLYPRQKPRRVSAYKR